VSGPERKERRYEWTPLTREREPMAGLSGVEFFRASMRGEVPMPPISETIGWTIVGVEKGLIRLRFEPQEYLFHGAGILHGGVLATLLDSAMASAVISTLDAGRACTTVSMTVSNIRAVRMGDGPLFAVGKVEHAGRRAATATGAITDETGRLYARAMTNCIIFAPEDPPIAARREAQ